MTDSARKWDIFMEMHSGLPRQGPGEDSSTHRALQLCTELPDTPRILDVGCGTGMQTLALARATDGPITAVDLFPSFLDELATSATVAGLRDRLTLMQGDMTALPFPPASFDLIWSEGAIYIMGVAAALTTWRPLLRAGGYIVFSEAVWLKSNPPQEVAQFWGDEYPSMTTAEGVRAQILSAGYTTIGYFTLPNRAWWDLYYTPLEAKLPVLRAKYDDDPTALEVLNGAAREIDICRHYGDWYGYEFFITQKP